MPPIRKPSPGKHAAPGKQAALGKQVSRGKQAARKSTGLTRQAVHRLIMAVPGTTEGAHHGHPDYRSGGKIFASFSNNGERINFRSNTVNVDAMVSADPETFRDAWAGRWVGVLISRVDAATIAGLARDAAASLVKSRGDRRATS